jgi:hypothetical protein
VVDDRVGWGMCWFMASEEVGTLYADTGQAVLSRHLRLSVQKMISPRMIVTVAEVVTPAIIFVREVLEPLLNDELVLDGADVNVDARGGEGDEGGDGEGAGGVL